MGNIIRIKSALFYAYHGVFKEEQNIGGKFEADIEMHTDFTEAARKDDLNGTINYEAVYKLVCSIAIQKKYKLIESLAANIAQAILDNFDKVEKVYIKVRKNNPPIGGVVDFVEVEVMKERFF